MVHGGSHPKVGSGSNRPAHRLAVATIDPSIRRILSTVTLLAIIFTLSLAGLTPSRPRPINSPATQFSALRALGYLKGFIDSEMPHPVGSPPNDADRARILSELSALGYQTSVQTAFTCSQFGSCATVNNVLARINGRDAASSPDGGAPAVLLAAHYDSVPAGPGVSDDAAGVAAILEIARALKSLPAPRHSIVFLIDDGEEAGLLGARAFIEKHPWSRDVRAVVNLEARGTSGPSLMFETGTANAWAVRLFSQSAARPVTDSIFYAVYKTLPNSTDFAVFKAAGYQGLNFAFIGSEPHYHTPLDNVANLSLRSLQHQGNNALSSVVSLANSDLSAIPQSESVYFDVFSMGVVHFSSHWAVPLALITILLLAFQIVWLIRNRRLAPPELLWGLALWLAAVAGAAALAYLLRGLMRFGSALLVNWVAHPFPVELAFWSLAAALLFNLGILFGPRARFWGLWAGVWSWWALVSFVCSLLERGVSYVFLLPVLVAAFVALPATLRRPAEAKPLIDRRLTDLAAILPPVSAGLVAFAPLLLLYDGLGNRALPLIAALVALALTPLLPLCADLLNTTGTRGALFSWIPVAAAIAGVFIAVVAPQFSAKAPERVNLQYWKDSDTNVAEWIVDPDSGRLPEALRVAASFKHADKGPFPWDRGPAYLTPAPRLEFSAPSFTILQSSPAGAVRKYRALLRSERGAPEVAALFPPNSGVSNVSMQGEPIDGASDALRAFFGGWDIFRCLTSPAEGVELSFSLPMEKPVQVFVVDVNYGLPPEGRFLLTARPLTAAPSNQGDVTIVSRSVQILP